MRAMGVVLPCGVSPSGRDSTRGCDMTAPDPDPSTEGPRGPGLPRAGRPCCLPVAVQVRLVLGIGPLLAAATFLAVCVAAAVFLPADLYTRVVSNVVQVLAPAVAAGALGWRARPSPRRGGSTWAALGLGCGGWAVGQAWWAHQEIAGAGIPFPSVADLGFVAFPVLAATALLLHPTDGGARGLWRRTSDAVMTTAAVGLVSWESALGAIADRAAEEGRLAGALFLAYPVLDVVLIVLAVLTAARTRQPRLPLLVCAGLVALSVSDTVSAYLQAAGSYRGGSVDVGWVAGFLLLALAGTARPPAAGDRTAGPPSTAGGGRPLAALHADPLPRGPPAGPPGVPPLPPP